MKRALVTGCAGFIGSHLTESLLRDGWQVEGIDNLSTGLERNVEFLQSIGSDRFYFSRRDLHNCEMFGISGERYEAIFHLAALGSVPRSLADPEATFDSNVSAFFQLLQAMRKSEKPPRLVFASSSSVYGDQKSYRRQEFMTYRALSPYAASKQANESFAAAFAKSYGLQIVGLRYFNVFGPRQRSDSPFSAVIANWTRAMLKRDPVEIFGYGHKGRDFTPVSEVVRATRLAAELRMYPGGDYDVFNVGCGQSTTIQRVFEILKKLTGYPHDPLYRPSRAGDIDYAYADTEKAERILKFRAEMTDERLEKELALIVEHARTELADYYPKEGGNDAGKSESGSA